MMLLIINKLLPSLPKHSKGEVNYTILQISQVSKPPKPVDYLFLSQTLTVLPNGLRTDVGIAENPSFLII